MMVLAILLIGLTLEETLHLYSLALLEEIEDCLVIVLDPALEALIHFRSYQRDGYPVSAPGGKDLLGESSRGLRGQAFLPYLYR